MTRTISTQAISKLLVANRGEIAVRIIRAAKALGIPTVAACSEADVDSMAARLADEVQVLGPARADQSYLNVQALLGALQASGANAVHPGYGFLSENAEFAAAVEATGRSSSGPARTPFAAWATRPKPGALPRPPGCRWCRVRPGNCSNSTWPCKPPRPWGFRC